MAWCSTRFKWLGELGENRLVFLTIVFGCLFFSFGGAFVFIKLYRLIFVGALMLLPSLGLFGVYVWYWVEASKLEDAGKMSLRPKWTRLSDRYLRLPWVFGERHLRRCLSCGTNQFTHYQRCVACDDITVGTDLFAVLEGLDLASILGAEDYYRSKKRMRNLVKLLWCLAVIGLLLVFFVGFGVGLAIGILIVALLCHFSALAFITWSFIRRYGRYEFQSQKCSPELGGKLESICEKTVYPFLQRNRITEGQSVDIPPDEKSLLIEHLAEDRVSLDPKSFRAFTTTCALRRDFHLFRQRVEVNARTAQISLKEAYANLFPQESNDRIVLPFLRQMLAFRDEPTDREIVLANVTRIRRENKLKGFALDLDQRREGDGRTVIIDDVDRMDPFNFELLAGMIYQAQGFAVTETPKSGDQGADVFLEKAGEKTVVQTKLYSDSVGNHAVQEVIAARSHFRCQHAVVLSNSYFTRSAKELAMSTNVKLVDREELKAMLDIFNKSPKDYSRLALLLKPMRICEAQILVLPSDGSPS